AEAVPRRDPRPRPRGARRRPGARPPTPAARSARARGAAPSTPRTPIRARAPRGRGARRASRPRPRNEAERRRELEEVLRPEAKARGCRRGGCRVGLDELAVVQEVDVEEA